MRCSQLPGSGLSTKNKGPRDESTVILGGGGKRTRRLSRKEVAFWVPPLFLREEGRSF